MKLGDIFSFKGGGTPSKSEPRYWGGDICWASVKDIKGNYLYGTCDKITRRATESCNTSIAAPGDVILVTRISPGKAIIAKVETAINQDLKIVLPKVKTSPAFTKYLFNSLEKKCIERSSGTTVLGISINNLSEIQILLPPFAEQKRIVAKIEELFSSLDKGIERLKVAQQQLKIYRQSVLKWAFEGRFTQIHTGKNDIPNGWQLQKLADITIKIKIGPFGTQLHKEDYVENGISLVNPMHIQDGQIIPNIAYTITQEKRDTLTEYILEDGDIILGRRGEMGRCALVQAKESGWLCGTGSLYIRPDREFLFSKYLYYLIGSESIKKYLA